jgi:radical SAM superfamily enzyme YgiQ (UPF0313 family)
MCADISIDKIKVVLGDIRHKTVGLHSSYVPLGIGYIGSYALSQFEEGLMDVKLFTDPDEIINEIEVGRPHLVGVSNYLWNSNISNKVCEIAKRIDREIVTVSGGPEFPINKIKRNQYMHNRPDIDFYVYEDGEVALSNLINKLIEFKFNINKVKSIKNDGIISLKPNSREMLLGNPIERFNNMDLIPSPYLSGLFDKFLSSNYMPALETTRGCPYTCAYCHTGNPHKVCEFSAERIKAELDYIVDNTDNIKNKGLSIFDDNFGLYKKDPEIAEHLAYLKKRTGWPMVIEGGGTVKIGGNTFLSDYEIYKTKDIGSSFQTLNRDTLNVIKRKNPSKKRIKELAKQILEKQDTIPCELIAPLPLETKASYFQTQKFLIENGFYTQTYTTMLLKGTPLASDESRLAYQVTTKYRVIPRQFGEYNNKKVFETEEVCVSTNTLSFKDYIDIRGFSLIVKIFTAEQFNIVKRHLREYKISFFDYIYEIWEKVKNDKSELMELYNGFISEAANELFDTEEDLFNHFSKPENYELLLNLTTSDNLIRKYTAKAYFLKWDMLLEFSYNILKNSKKLSEDQIESLDAAKEWAFKLRNVTEVFNDKVRKDKIITMLLPYDVMKWYNADIEKPLHLYKERTTYKIYCGKKYMKTAKFLEASAKQLKGDNEFIFGSFITRGYRLYDLWLECEKA